MHILVLLDEELLEKIVAQPKDVLNTVYYYHKTKVNGTSRTTVEPTLEDPLLSYTDNEKTGRCYTIVPTNDMITFAVTNKMVSRNFFVN